MLGKLFKYEFNATGRVFLPMYGALLVMAVVSHLFYNADMDMDNIFIVLLTLLMVMLFTAVWIVTLVIIVRRFYTNLLGREGYLMNVLPVSPWQHVLAKTGTSAVWIIAGMIVSFAAFFVMLLGLPEFTNVDLREFWDGLRKGLEYLRENGELGKVILFLVEFILEIILESCQFVLTAYAAMCIGQLAANHRTLASIGAYFGINIAESFVMQLIGRTNVFEDAMFYPSTYPAAFRGIDGVNLALALYMAETLLMCAAMFFLSSVLLKKKLNLQ